MTNIQGHPGRSATQLRRASQTASQLGQKIQQGHWPCAARTAQNTAYVRNFSIHMFLLKASPRWCRTGLSANW